MRKFLSVIMVIAMLATSILPAIANVAAADAALAVEMQTVGFVENADGTVTADIDLAITNNPGFTDLRVLVYYTNSEISVDAFTAADAYADYASDSGLARRSTLAAVKSAFTAAGVSTSASRYAADINVNCYDPESGDPITASETGVFGTLTISPADGAFSADMAYEIGIIVAEATDADGEEIEIDPVTYTTVVGAKPADPYASVYETETFDADKFVVNVAGTKVYENGFVDGEAKTADVRVEFHGNNEQNNPFGVWGFRCFVYYPAELTAISYTNGDIFKASEMMKFEDCATNLDVVADANHATVISALEGFAYVGYETYAEDGLKLSLIQYIGTNWYDCTFGDGLLETITFQLPDDAAAGDKWEIGICSNGTGDMCHNGGSTEEDQHPEIEPAPIAPVYDNGYIEVISVKEESFDEFTFSAEDITISADNKTAQVKLYVSGNSEEVNPYGFWAARLFIYYPAELTMANVEQGKIVPEGGFTNNLNIDLKGLIADPAQANNVLVTAAPLALEEQGFDWENEDFGLTCVYFQAPSDADCIVKDGHYATLTFNLPAGATGEYSIGVATCYENADVIGYMNDPALSSTRAEALTHSLDSGSINLVGEAVVEPETPEHVHELEYTAAVDAGCHYIGNTEYWYCAGCDTVFADEAATQITNRKNVIIPATGSDLLVAMDAVEPGCHYNGNIAYWVCYECEQVWADEALTQLTNIKNVILPATGSENLVHVDAKAPTFAEDGNIEYWYCEDCEQVWQDEALTQLTNFKNVIIPALTQATVSVGTASVTKGDDAEVAISIVNNPGLFIAKYIVTYDASVLTLVSATNGDLFADDYVIINTDVAGEIVIYLENAEVADVAVDGVLANLVFATDAEAEAGDYAIEIVADAENNINAAGEDVAIEAVAGKVTLNNCTHENTTPVVAVDPTVYDEGLIEYICDKCGEVADTEAIPMLAGIEIAEWQPTTVGERQAYAVDLLNNPGVWSLSVKVAYDAYCLEFVQVDSVLFTADEYSYSVADGVVTIYVEADDLNNITEDGSAFYIVFDTVMCGYSDLDVELVAENTINAAGENVAFECIDGSTRINCALTHSPFVAPSDVNGWQEFWYCEYCGSMYDDAQGRYMTNRMRCYIPANSISLEADGTNVNVNLDSNYGIWSLGLEVTFDADALTLVGIESGIFAIDENSYSVNDGVITIFVENAEVADVTDTGVAFTLVFEGNVGGTYDIDAALIADNTINAASENVKFAVAGTTVEVAHVCQLEYFEAVEASCHQNGMQEYWYCAECDVVYADENATIVTNRKNLVTLATAEIIYVEATEAACCQNGNVEYWYCAECNAVFTDAALTQLSNFKSVVIPATGEITYVEAVEASCHQNGSAAYYYCAECEAVYDEDYRLTNRKNLVIPATAEIIYVEAVEASCCQAGNTEYWYCAECDAVFADAALTQLTNRKNVMIPATAEIIYVEAVEASCCQNGSAAYYYCSECDSVFDEDFRLTNRKNLVIPATAEIVYVEAVEAACHQNGSAAYYYCSECDAVYDEDFRLTNRKNLTIPATAEIIYVEAVEAVCHQTGNVEYWYCAECEAVFTDAALTQLSNFKSVIIPAAVELTYVAATEATCTENGNNEYWYCAECDAVFADAMGAIITNRLNVVIPANGHVAGDKVVTVEPTVDAEGAWEITCTVCGEVIDSGIIAKLQFLTKASGSDYAKSATLEGDVITVVARPGAPYVKFAVGFEKGLKVVSDNRTGGGATFAYIVVNYDETEAKIVATDANGNSMEYTVVVEWADEFYLSYVGGYTTDDVTVENDVVDVYVKKNMKNASVGFILAEGTTYVAGEGLAVEVANGRVYFKAAMSDVNNTYTVTFTTRSGAVKVVTINFYFDYVGLDNLLEGYMVDGIEFSEDGNVVDITVNASYKYASFRFLLKNTKSVITYEEGVEEVVTGTNKDIHWFKIFNDGTGYVTKTFTVTHTVTGVSEDYTVNVKFGSNN